MTGEHEARVSTQVALTVDTDRVGPDQVRGVDVHTPGQTGVQSLQVVETAVFEKFSLHDHIRFSEINESFLF